MFLFAKATSLGSGVIKMGNGSFSKIANHIPYTPLPPRRVMFLSARKQSLDR